MKILTVKMFVMDNTKNIVITGSRPIGSHSQKITRKRLQGNFIDIKSNNIEAKPSNNFIHFTCDILDEEKLKVALSQSQEKLGPIKGLQIAQL